MGTSLYFQILRISGNFRGIWGRDGEIGQDGSLRRGSKVMALKNLHLVCRRNGGSAGMAPWWDTLVFNQG